MGSIDGWIDSSRSVKRLFTFVRPIFGEVIIYFLSVKKNERGRFMIEVTKLNDDKFVLNAELIKTVEETPDTVITITTGNKYIVKESVEDVIQKVVTYKKRIFTSFME